MMKITRFLRNPAVRQVGGPVAHLAARRYMGEGKPLDLRLGITLFKDKRVPVAAKMAALMLGTATMMLWNLLELPVEALIALLLPFIGFAFEVAWNGAETLNGAILFSGFILPHVAPKELVARVRSENAGPIPVPVEEPVYRNR